MRMEKAEQHRQQFKEDFECEMEIRAEIRRLKREDKFKLQERQRAQMNLKKLMILAKEKEHENNIERKKKEQELIIHKKREFSIKALHERIKAKE